MTMKQVLIPALMPMRDRDPRIVDSIVGPRRAKDEPKVNIDWSKCRLAKLYPTLDDLGAELAAERQAAKLEGRDALPVAKQPSRKPHHPQGQAAAPWDDGPSACDVRKAYSTPSGYDPLK